MALAAGPERQVGKLVIRNIGLLLSGKLEAPILEADTVVAENGKIVSVGRANDCDTGDAKVVIDAQGSALAPGLIDSHVHPVLGDWTPRQSQLNWIESSLNGGVTTMISAGEVHTPGRPRDVIGVKALAIAAQRSYDNFRPVGVKVLAGAPVLEQGMEEADFADLARSGVKLLGEVGLGTVKAGDEARRMVAWARKYGIQSTIHTGGPSVPGSGYIDADTVLEADADIIGHINGGHTALPATQIRCLCERCGRGIEIVHNGNELAGLTALRIAKEIGQLQRVILRHGRAGRIGRAAAGDLADGGDAVLAWRYVGRADDCVCNRKHGTYARSGLRHHRIRARGGFRADGSRAAFLRQGHSGQHPVGRSAGDRYGGDRWDRALRAKPQYTACRARADRGDSLTVALSRYVLEENVGFILRQVTQRHLSLFSAMMVEDLTPTQFSALFKLYQYGPCSQNRLGRMTAMDNPTIKGVIDRLTRRGLTVSGPDPTDARLLIVSLTTEGRAVIERALPRAQEITEATLAPLSSAQRTQFLSLLEMLK